MSIHIEAKKEDIASKVIMPGDPLRAKYIAEKYLTNFKIVNNVRNMTAYTGYYKDVLITIVPSGMGIPSMGIYSYELFNEYNVEEIIRIGTCGSYKKEINLRDVILVEASFSYSKYNKLLNNDKNKIIKSSLELNERISNIDNNLIKGNVHSSDVFYLENGKILKKLKTKNLLAVEMESFALFSNAKKSSKKAACLLTVSDSIYKEEVLTSKEREQSLDKMILIALEALKG